MIRSILYASVFYAMTAIYLVFGSFLLVGPRAWAMAALKFHGVTAMWLLRLIVGTRFELRGVENVPKAAALVASKHQSAWDTFGLVPLMRDPALVMKRELFWIPFYGWFSHKFGMIPVDREGGPSSLRKVLKDARGRAAAAREIVIFPEGTRRAPGDPPDYKSGVVLLYQGLGLPCVPVALNSGVFWPRRSWRRYPGTIVVEFLPPIPPGLKRAEFLARLEQAIEPATARLVAEADAARGVG